MSRPLHELALEAIQIAEALTESGGELTPEIETALAVNESSLAQKIDAYGAVFDRLEAEANYWRKQRDEAARMIKAFENADKRLSERLKDAMLAMGKQTIEGNGVRMRLSNAKPSLVIDPNAEIPTKYLTQVTTYEPDKLRLREDLENGTEVFGVSLRPSYALRITKTVGVK